MSSRFKGLVLFLFLPLFFYFSLYTWNWKTGHLDKFATAIGLDLAGWILSPGRWVQNNIDDFWSRYVYLVGVRQENEDLTARIHSLEYELAQVKEKASSADRLLGLLDFAPESGWMRRGCRVIGQKLGPNAVLDTLLVDLGTSHGVTAEAPVVASQGLVGRLFKPGLFFSSVLLVSDPTSRIPVLSREGRVPAIVQGQGAGAYLEVKFIPRNDKISPGDILVTSGLGGIFPKGIPVARVVEVSTSDTSLFQKVYAESLVTPKYYEELLLLQAESNLPVMAAASSGGRGNATVVGKQTNGTGALPGPANKQANATTLDTNSTSKSTHGMVQPNSLEKKPKIGATDVNATVKSSNATMGMGGRSTTVSNATRVRQRAPLN